MNMPFLFSESLERLHKKSEKTSSLPPQNNTALGLVRLDPSNERSLVSEAPPGSITFALLVDVENVQEAVKSPLISAFSDVVHHYKRLVSFNFWSHEIRKSQEKKQHHRKVLRIRISLNDYPEGFYSSTHELQASFIVKYCLIAIV